MGARVSTCNRTEDTLAFRAWRTPRSRLVQAWLEASVLNFVLFDFFFFNQWLGDLFNEPLHNDVGETGQEGIDQNSHFYRLRRGSQPCCWQKCLAPLIVKPTYCFRPIPG